MSSVFCVPPLYGFVVYRLFQNFTLYLLLGLFNFEPPSGAENEETFGRQQQQQNGLPSSTTTTTSAGLVHQLHHQQLQTLLK